MIKFALYLCSICLIFPQNLFYYAVDGADSLGSFQLIRTSSSDSVFITTDAKMTFSIFILGDFKYSAKSRSVFLNSVLQSHQMSGVVRDKKPFSSIEKVGNSYNLKMKAKNVDRDETISKEIKQTFLELYFEEPLNTLELFSENTGEFVAIEKITSHRYEVEINGNTWQLNYKNGVLVAAEFDGLIDYTLMLDFSKSDKNRN